jgi:hypothetical protein
MLPSNENTFGIFVVSALPLVDSSNSILIL